MGSAAILGSPILVARSLLAAEPARQKPCKKESLVLSKRGALWGVPALFYVIFFVWYTDLGGPTIVSTGRCSAIATYPLDWSAFRMASYA